MKILFVFTLNVGLAISGFAQTLEQFRQEQDSAQQALREDRQNFEQQYVKDFNQFVAERDSLFAEMLRERFREIELSRALQITPAPKPTIIPTYPPNTQPPANQEVETDTASGPLRRSRSLMLPLPAQGDERGYTPQRTQLSFYDNSLFVPYDVRMQLPEYSRYDAEVLSEAWVSLSEAYTKELIHSLYRYKNQFNLNDWGYYQLVRQFTQQLYPSDDARATLTAWFLLNKSRYRAKIGYTDNQLYLLIPTNCTVYSATYYQFGDQTYYAIGEAPNSLYTYDQDYAGADLILNLDVQNPLSLGGNPQEKTFSFRYGGEAYQVQLAYNARAIEFYQDYPEVDLRVKLESTLSREAKESLILQFQPLLQDRTSEDAVGLLLRFVQTAFDYQLDQTQFGREKYFFPEEVLHFTYSDCEDRSALFTYLVRQLLGLKVVGLQYPGHVATAVGLDGVEGEYVERNREQFVVCDPTYVNAPIGKVMPRYAQKQVELVPLRNPYQQWLAEMIWDIASSNGVYPGANNHNLVVDALGNIYFAGYRLSPQVSEGQNIYLAKLTPNGKVLWEKTLNGRGNDVGQYLAINSRQQVYLAGRYEEELRLDTETQLNTSAIGFFVAKFSPNGQLAWLRDVTTQQPDLQQGFVAKLNEQGKLMETLVFDNTVAERGIALDESGSIYFSEQYEAATQRTRGISVGGRSVAENNASLALDVAETLKAESDRLKEQQYDPTIAGLFAVIHCIMQSGMVIPGTAALEALDRHNPAFRQDCPEIYANIGKLKFMKNESGIITIVNEEGGNVDFDKMRIKDQAKIRLRTFDDGNAQVDVLTGITVGKAFVRFNLNHVKLFKQDGSLLFDYDNDHTQVVMNLREDILY
ncbi:hypothetical protein [Tunicatimonas pelagia]|uniref:hypothetical protein n=1 Tax=Tunicatimonas pelagia TaxID=931531 RepID=UPI00266658E3|nr:hypothetical protein [Tunicatimonas pelagia]WKN44410.1 hypothetical protein P0M28_05460 [Tunicatimonas pelagia]